MRISDWSSDVFSSDLLPVGRYGVHESEQIRYAHIVYCRCIQFGRVGDACQGGVTAVAAAVDGYALGVGNALINQPLYAVGNVVLHGQTPLAETGLPEFAAIASGSANVHLQQIGSAHVC